MSSDLLILYPDIPQATTRMIAADSFSGTINELENYPAWNTTRGPRWQMFRRSGAATDDYITYDLGPSQTKASNFLIVSRLDILRAEATAIAAILERSDTDGSWGTAHQIVDIDAATLYGPNSDDYIGIFTLTNNYRYWRFRFSAGATYACTVGKVYFGTSIDLGNSPDDYEIERVYDSQSKLITSAGSLFIGRSSSPRYELTLRWKGITNAAVQSFFTNIYPYRLNTGFFLHTLTYHDILNGHRLLHCALVDAYTDNSDEKADYNTLTTKWVELLG